MQSDIEEAIRSDVYFLIIYFLLCVKYNIFIYCMLFDLMLSIFNVLLISDRHVHLLLGTKIHWTNVKKALKCKYFFLKK